MNGIFQIRAAPSALGEWQTEWWTAISDESRVKCIISGSILNNNGTTKGVSRPIASSLFVNALIFRVDRNKRDGQGPRWGGGGEEGYKNFVEIEILRIGPNTARYSCVENRISTSGFPANRRRGLPLHADVYYSRRKINSDVISVVKRDILYFARLEVNANAWRGEKRGCKSGNG